MLAQGEDLEVNGCTNSAEIPNEGWVVDFGCSHNILEKVLKLGENTQISSL